MDAALASNNRRLATLGHWAARPGVQLWGYLLLVTLAELITSLVSPQLGQLTHVLLLLGLILHAALAPAGPARRLLMALTLAPLIRVLSLAMPLLRFPQLAWYPLTAVPLLIATLIVMRQLRLGRADVGLRPGHLPLQLLLAGVGCALGAIEFAILTPVPILNAPDGASFGLAALSLLVFTGFSEELIFRGVLQTVAMPALGRWTILYVAILFGVLHIGYLSVTDVLFVTGVGLLFGFIVYWSGSILGVTLAHGATNIMLFLVLPYLRQHPEITPASLPPIMIALGTLLSLLAATLLFWLHRFAQVASPARSLFSQRLGELREVQGLSRFVLARRVGLSPSEVTEFEFGIRLPQLSEIQRFAVALQIDPQLLLPVRPHDEYEDDDFPAAAQAER